MHLVGWGENIVSFLTGREGYVPTLCKKKTTTHVIRNFSKPRCFQLCPTFLPREGSPNKTIPNYVESKGAELV